jgi:hypothetical protein
MKSKKTRTPAKGTAKRKPRNPTEARFLDVLKACLNTAPPKKKAKKI